MPPLLRGVSTPATSALELIRSLVEKIVIHPQESGAFAIELIGEIAKMVEIALGDDDGRTKERTALNEVERRSAKVVAGARFELTTFRL